MNVDDLLNLNKMPVHHSNFWKWCNKKGIVSKPLIISDRPILTDNVSPPIRGLFTAYELPHGSIVAKIPFHASMGVHTLLPLYKQNVLNHCFLPHKLSLALGRIARVTPYESQYLWLTAVLATLKTHILRQNAQAYRTAQQWEPYLSLLPNTYIQEELYARDTLLAKLNSVDKEDYQSSVDIGRKHLHLLHELIQYKVRRHRVSGVVPSLHALVWAYKTVLARAVVVPAGCVPSAPLPLEELLENEDIPVIPVLLPVVDLINSPALWPDDTAPPGSETTREEGNCEIYTCEHNEDIHASTGDSTNQCNIPSVNNSSMNNRFIVVATKRLIEAGEELSFDYTDTLPPGVSLYRHRFISN